MSLLIGVVISSPIWIYQLWAFITPGLTKKERHYTLGYMAAAVPLFLAGVWVGWMVTPQVVRNRTLAVSMVKVDIAAAFSGRRTIQPVPLPD